VPASHQPVIPLEFGGKWLRCGQINVSWGATTLGNPWFGISGGPMNQLGGEVNWDEGYPSDWASPLWIQLGTRPQLVNFFGGGRDQLRGGGMGIQLVSHFSRARMEVAALL